MVGRDVAQTLVAAAAPERERQRERMVVDQLQVEQHVLGALAGTTTEHVEQCEQADPAEILERRFDRGDHASCATG